ncbi:MAG: chalcone isomerase family protein [Oceanipulchritudo sp.]
MNRNTLSLLFFLCLLGLAQTPALAAFEDSVEVDGKTLLKTGQGNFRWMFIKVYEGALYMDAEKPGADPLEDVAKQLVLEYRVEITAEEFRKSGSEFLRRNVDEKTLDSIQDRLERLHAAYVDVGKGDRYTLSYLPEKGTTLSLNGEPLVTVEGPDFAQAYYTIWLGENPVKDSFRDALLEGR